MALVGRLSMVRITRTKLPEETTELTPEEFERTVRDILEKCGASLDSFVTRHGENVAGTDGSYVIDVTARFKALGADFLVLVECKHHKSPIKREMVQVLHDKMQSTGAQKGMLFASTGFQSGAIEYAKVHGIALVRVADGTTACLTLSRESVPKPPPSARDVGFVGWLASLSPDGDERWELIETHDSRRLRSFLGLEEPT